MSNTMQQAVETVVGLVAEGEDVRRAIAEVAIEFEVDAAELAEAVDPT